MRVTAKFHFVRISCKSGLEPGMRPESSLAAPGRDGSDPTFQKNVDPDPTFEKQFGSDLILT